MEIYKKPSPFKVFTISSKNKNIITSGGMKVISDYSFSDAPKFDILLIPEEKEQESLFQITQF